jgi:hypothetical protein
MRVNHRLVYAGVFLVALGGVLVATDQGAIANETLVALLRLWPLAIIAIGLGLVLRRTQIGFSTGMLAAAVPGLLLGGAFAAAPRFVGICSDGTPPVQSTVDDGSFDGPATVAVVSGCGTLTIGTAPGTGWRLASGSTAGRQPRVHPSPNSLAVDLGGGNELGFLDSGRDAWDLSLPTSAIDSLLLTVNASSTTAALPGASLGDLQVTGNASAVSLDLTGATVESLHGRINLGKMAVRLPDGSTSGTFRVDAGQLELCAPADAGLLVTVDGEARDVHANGVLQTASNVWMGPSYDSAVNHLDISVRVDLGLLEINPIGGCA